MYAGDYSKDDQVISFSTKKEAAEFLHNNKKLCYYEGSKNLEQAWSVSGMYVYSYGETAPPEYVVRRYKDGWGIKIIYYYYCGALFAPKDRRCVKLDFDVIA
jgi:hypothetical protein